MKKQTNDTSEELIWQNLRANGYDRGTGNNVVDSSRLFLGTLNPDGTVKMQIYPDQRALRQLELERYLTGQGIKCIRIGSEEAINAIRAAYNQLENILSII